MAQWDKTDLSVKRLQQEGKLGANNNYKGRFIIHRDSPIDGGVYLGQGKREAIVVDTQYGEINRLYETAKQKASINGTFERDKVLHAVYDTVLEAMPKQDDNAVTDLVKRHNVEDDGKIALDVFIKEGVGVCRHDALACGTILELFKKDGFVKGKASIDRNSTYLGGHAWCRYLNSTGEIFVLDVAQGYIGKLEDAKNGNRWAYDRPEDY